MITLRTYNKPSQIQVQEILLQPSEDTIIKVSSVEAIERRKNQTLIHIKRSGFIQIATTKEEHKALIATYKELLQPSLPNRASNQS